MTRRIMPVIVSLVVFSLLLSGCKLPASTAPDIFDEEAMTTPIVILTEELGLPPQDEIDEAYPGEPVPTEDFFAEPTSTPLPTIAVPTLTRPATYTLQEGEFPFCIARRFDLDPQALLSLNNLGPNDRPPAGTALQIPQTGNWTAGDRSLNPHPTTHTVLAGQTVFSIACFYGAVSPEAIIAVNSLQEPYTLTAGQTLEIP